MCATGEATGNVSCAERIFLEMVVASTSRTMVDVSWARAAVADKMSPNQNSLGRGRLQRTRFNKRKGNSLFTPMPASHAGSGSGARRYRIECNQ